MSRAPRAVTARVLLVLLVLLVLVVLVAAGLLAAIVNNRVPLTDPPGLTARLKTYLTRNVVVTTDSPVYPERATLVIDVAPEKAREKLVQVVTDLGWQLAPQVDEPFELDAEVRSRWFGFVDDVRLRIVPAGAGRSRIEVRSSSRVGRGDLGANTRHLLDLREALSRAGS